MVQAPHLHPATLLIRKLESIATLSNEDRVAILRLPTRVRQFEVRQNIAHEGDQPSHCCLILDGWVCRHKVLSVGKRQIFSFHIAGDVPDLQNLHIRAMDHSLTAVTKVTVALVPHESIRDLIDRHPTICALLWRDTLIDAGIFREWMIGIGRRSAFQRIAHLFCEMYLKLQAVGLARDFRCPMPITQADLADALGLTGVHVNRVLMAMRAQTLITLHSSTLVITDWDKLLRVSEFDPAYLHLEKRAVA